MGNPFHAFREINASLTLRQRGHSLITQSRDYSRSSLPPRSVPFIPLIHYGETEGEGRGREFWYLI
jgi:hypothetical protein